MSQATLQNPMTENPTAKSAQAFMQLLQKGDFLAAIDQFYAPNIENIESMMPSDAPNRVIKGFDAVKAYNREWTEENEVHSCKLDGPFIGDNRFAVTMTIDVTVKATQKRMTMSELCLYTLENNKITRAEFLYDANSKCC
ncbi:MAG: nuclear transport factor 2 family protein [Vampirovibrionales bacterium]|nr:nuclear transport factor 2 family protein [Vampirovibrionales bacterium]